MDNLKEFLRGYSAIPMDDPQDRGDLYLLAPMRILSPIVEESEPATNTNTNLSRDDNYEVHNHYELNRSILTVISEILVPPPPPPPNGAQRRPPPPPPPQLFQESQSSLVHTIEELRNSSLCNLFFSSATASFNSSDAGSGSQESPVKSIRSNTLVPSPARVRSSRPAQP